jgi:hypothetical protein
MDFVQILSHQFPLAYKKLHGHTRGLKHQHQHETGPYKGSYLVCRPSFRLDGLNTCSDEHRGTLPGGVVNELTIPCLQGNSSAII